MILPWKYVCILNLSTSFQLHCYHPRPTHHCLDGYSNSLTSVLYAILLPSKSNCTAGRADSTWAHMVPASLHSPGFAGSLVLRPSLLCSCLKHAKPSSISRPSLMLLSFLKCCSSFSMGLAPHPSGLSFHDTFSGRPFWILEAGLGSPFYKLQGPCDFPSYHFLQLLIQSYLCSFLFNFSLTHYILRTMREHIFQKFIHRK